MPETRSRFSDALTLDGLWKISQIAAVIVGGYWTWDKFIKVEAPLLEPRVATTRDLGAPLPHPDGCLRSFVVGLKNTGTSVFKVTRVVTRAWSFTLRRDEDTGRLMDLEQIEDGKPLFAPKDFPDPAYAGQPRHYPFIQSYRKDDEYSHEFVLVLARDPDAWVYVKTELYLAGDPVPRVAGAWAPMCGDGALATPAPTREPCRSPMSSTDGSSSCGCTAPARLASWARRCARSRSIRACAAPAC